MAYTRQELEELVNRHAPAVYRLAFARTGSREDAEDVMQEVFLRLLRRSPELNGEAGLAAPRGGQLRQQPAPPPLAAAGAAPGGGHRPDASAGARRGFDGGAGPAGEVPGAGVPPLLRGVHPAEVAAILGKKEATVRTWLFRARGLLRDMLCEEESYER